MIGEENEVLMIDCAEEDYLCSPTMSDSCRKQIAGKTFDRLRLKSKLVTKEYDQNLRLLTITPFFVDVRLGAVLERVKYLKTYEIKTGAKVSILERLDSIGYIYFIQLPEMNVTFQQLHQIYNEVEAFKQTGLTKNAFIKRWYLEYGILEHLLFDDNILEININPPAHKTPVRIVHAEFDECVSNVYPSQEFLDYLATQLKIATGRPLNKAQPQLDGEIIIGEQRARVAAVADPFSILGTGYSIRKHREHPWTLPLFMENKTINGWFAGLLSLAITHGRTFLTAGPRGSGKTSLLGALLLEILPKYRIITIEDTQELPINAYKKLGYDILPLKVRSALLAEGMEMPFDTGLRTSLRLGDSCLIIGEIRSKEAKVLYEAMRVGAMANVVAGTIHGDSPYGVYDRVVNDLGVPKGSFKVTDLIIIVNQIKDPTGLKRVRRVLKVTEVAKHWEDEPVFQDLLVYNPQSDELEPTDALLHGKSIMLNQILEQSRGYKNYDDLVKDIKLRSWAKEAHTRIIQTKADLEAPGVIRANILFSNLSRSILPLESEEKEEALKQMFEEEFKKILKIQQSPNR